MNYKQKKRIKDAAKMVKNVRDMSSNMDSISSEYAKDLEGFFSAFVQKFTDKKLEPQTSNQLDSSALVLSEEKTEPTQKDEDRPDSEAQGSPGISKRPEKTRRPLKIEIKQLYRKIMQKCHPDRTLNDASISEADKVLFAYVLDVAMAAYKRADTTELIYAAALVDIFPQKTSMKSCLIQLNEMYAEKSKKIQTVQNSLAWTWGINWDTLETRFKIIMLMCAQNGINPPPKPDVLKFLVDFEIDS